MLKEVENIWSDTDFPYICLVDRKRTLTFKKAIDNTVKLGDIVVEVGAGTGILSLFAAAAGAKKVYAIEINPLLAEKLKSTVQINGYQKIIEVIQGDASKVELPKNVDVVIAELIETGLIDELQVPVMNSLHKKGVVGKKTKVIPAAYETFLQLVYVDNKFYGYKIAAPIHNWPYHSLPKNDWVQIQVENVSSSQLVGYFNFKDGFIQPKVRKVLAFKKSKNNHANAIKLSGKVHLTEQIQLDACNSVNGDKILLLDNRISDKLLNVTVEYQMGEGLSSFKIEHRRINEK